jgi:Tol biopolymer transport system component
MGRFGSGGISVRRHSIWLVGATSIVLLAIPASSLGSFAGQNGKIFYQGPESGNSGPGDIFSVNPDGSQSLDLTPKSGYSEERPAASADGQHVVFQSFRDEGWNIFSMNANGSDQTDLTNTVDPVVNFEPTWSPDGSKVAFMRQNQTPGEQDIWIMNANGTNQVDLRNSPEVDETAPEFSPDGSKIAYISSGPSPCCSTEYNNDIWVMNANGSNPTQLTKTNEPTQNTSPTWSPDGLKIAYSTTETPSASDDGIHVMNANGSEQTRLLNSGTPILTGNLSWSPDGTKIVYEGSGGGFLYTMNANGSGSTPLVANSGASYPSWVPVSGASGGGSSNPPSSGGSSILEPIPFPKSIPRLGKCKKGSRKKIVHGRTRCVKKHKSHKVKPKH